MSERADVPDDARRLEPWEVRKRGLLVPEVVAVYVTRDGAVWLRSPTGASVTYATVEVSPTFKAEVWPPPTFGGMP